MNETTPRAVATAYFEALRQGDAPTAMGLLSPQVVWHQPGANRFSGDHTGVDGIGALLGGMMEISAGTFQLAVTGPLMTNNEFVAAPVRFTGTHATASMDMTGIDLLTVREGKIVEVRLFSEDAPAEDAFWGQARP